MSVSYELQYDIQLMQFANYFGRAFSGMFKESPVAKIIEIPICHISEAIYKTSVDWIAVKSPGALADFVFWCLDYILVDLVIQQVVAKSSRKVTQKPPSKSQGDRVVGMHVWAHYLLPLISEKSDEVFGFTRHKSRPILINVVVRKGECIIPPFALDLLMRDIFPVPSARVKATERLEALYPTLKELAFAGSPGYDKKCEEKATDIGDGMEETDSHYIQCVNPRIMDDMWIVQIGYNI
ncbi:hypothetical protein IEQ34_018578 [Dendrobium chrysotoxum]|uniref:Uncharacterized protein n=1 Tax=Dendrobium chrysotoxum TaxID=161865 RepID=A0AAV7G6H0_DENCH|nr:hypothetical protein IEQ34_018578 [Dendrobium chrysotoxum]